MLLKLKPLFVGERDSLPIDGTLDFSGLTFQGVAPFPDPVRVAGEVAYVGGVVTLRVRVTAVYVGACDRCAAPIRREIDLPVEHVLVESLSDEENDDFVLTKDDQLLLDDLIRDDLLLSLPSKHLCREDCRGLCPQCGKDLNEGLCGCRTQAVDPRLEALKQLLD